VGGEMKVLVSDKLSEAGIEMLRAEEGFEVDVKTGLAPEDLKKIIPEYDALIIRSATQVTADVLEAATNLKVVGRAGIGVDNVDIPAATANGVLVMNAPYGNVITTAEHTIAMILSMSRHIPCGTASMRAGKWEKKNLQGCEIYQKTLGVVGYGKIGSVVADRGKGLRMNVIVADPVVSPEQIKNDGYEPVSFDELLRRSDYITFHVPKLPETAGMVGHEEFKKMKDGVMIVNCARGGVIQEDALYDALKSGKIAAAALDVFVTEPPQAHPLLEFDNFVCTPHLGASTKEAQDNVATDIAYQMIRYFKHNEYINVVNAPKK